MLNRLIECFFALKLVFSFSLLNPGQMIDQEHLVLHVRCALCVDCVIQMLFFSWVLSLDPQTSLSLQSFSPGIMVGFHTYIYFLGEVPLKWSIIRSIMKGISYSSFSCSRYGGRRCYVEQIFRCSFFRVFVGLLALLFLSFYRNKYCSLVTKINKNSVQFLSNIVVDICTCIDVLCWLTFHFCW